MGSNAVCCEALSFKARQADNGAHNRRNQVLGNTMVSRAECLHPWVHCSCSVLYAWMGAAAVLLLTQQGKDLSGHVCGVCYRCRTVQPAGIVVNELVLFLKKLPTCLSAKAYLPVCRSLPAIFVVMSCQVRPQSPERHMWPPIKPPCPSVMANTYCRQAQQVSAC